MVQLEALEKGYGKEGFAYFMRQRLGKTLTAYAEFCMLRDDHKVQWMIVICPNSLKWQWKEAIHEVNMIEPVCVYQANKKDDERYFFRKNKRGGVLIINYESLKSYVADARPPIDMNKAYMVADESTKIKEWSNKSTKAAVRLGDSARYRRILTGRPTANSNMDIWAQLRFIGATTRNYHQHRHTFCLLGGYMGRQVIANQNTDILQREMEPHCYIAPDKYLKGFNRCYEPLRFIQLTDTLKKQYKQMEDDLLFSIGEGVDITAPIALTRYLRLQQVGSGIAGLESGEQVNLVEPDRNPRIQAVVELLENECTNKTLIICRFTKSVDNLREVLAMKGYRVSVIDGRTPAGHIEEFKRNFNTGDLDVIIGQVQTLSYGHTLTGSDLRPCDSVIFYENDFSLINRAQVEARPEKMGRDVTISYYDFYSSKMDKYLLSTLIRKEDTSLALMGYAREHGMRTKESVEEQVKQETINDRAS